MKSVTEKVIFEQFPYWLKAMAQELPALPDKGIVVVGCGTSFYLAESLAAAFNLAGKRALAVAGTEWSAHPKAHMGDDEAVLVIGLSRSGESTETVEAVRESVARGQQTLAITCAPGSALAEAADAVIMLETHPEEGIVMTSSASLMLLAGLRLAGFAVGPDLVPAAQAALVRIEQEGPGLVRGRSHFVYLGAGILFGAAEEGALKLQEMSLSYAQSFYPLEYRHGPISLVTEASLLVMLYSTETKGIEEKVTADVTAKGAAAIGFGGAGDLAVSLAEDGPTRALEILPALQLLGEQVALAKGLDTTAPRHLTKVVTL